MTLMGATFGIDFLRLTVYRTAVSNIGRIPFRLRTSVPLVKKSDPSDRATGVRSRDAAAQRGGFYEAHEAWESIWVHEPNAEWRVFLQGLIQITSAFHKLVQRRPAGAARLLERGLAELGPYPTITPGCRVGCLSRRGS